MENLAVKLGYLSKTQYNAKKKDQENNQPEALHMLLRRNKLPQMRNTSKLKPIILILTSNVLLLHHHAVRLSSYCWLSVHASKEKKQVKTTSQDLNSSTKIKRVSMSVHDFKCNDDTTAYHKDEHQNRMLSYDPSYPSISLNYICHLFCIIWCKISFPCCLWLYCLCLTPPRTNDESKGNTTTNSKGKKFSTISNKRMGKSSSDMLPIYICPYTVLFQMRTVNIYICLILNIVLFQTVQELLGTALALNSKVKDLLVLIWVEVYFLSVTENVWIKDVTLYFLLVKIVYYNDWLLYSFFNKVHKSNP